MKIKNVKLICGKVRLVSPRAYGTTYVGIK